MEKVKPKIQEYQARIKKIAESLSGIEKKRASAASTEQAKEEAQETVKVARDRAKINYDRAEKKYERVRAQRTAIVAEYTTLVAEYAKAQKDVEQKTTAWENATDKEKAAALQNKNEAEATMAGVQAKTNDYNERKDAVAEKLAKARADLRRAEYMDERLYRELVMPGSKGLPTPGIVKTYMQRAGGDLELAKQMMLDDGYSEE